MVTIKKIFINLETGLLNFFIEESVERKNALEYNLHYVLVGCDKFQTKAKVSSISSANRKYEVSKMKTAYCNSKNDIPITNIYSCHMKQGNFKIRLLKSYLDNCFYQFVSKKKASKPIKIKGEMWESIRSDLLTKFSATIVYLDTYTKVSDTEKIKDILFSLIVKR